MEFHHFDAAGFVSIWAGEFPSVYAARSYLQLNSDGKGDALLAPWMREFGFASFNHDSLQTRGHGDKVGPLHGLIEQCSHAASFVDAAMQAAKQQGMTQTQYVMLLYDFRYDPSVTGITRGKYLRFLGALSHTNTTRDGLD
jgi:hypothetical protein